MTKYALLAAALFLGCVFFAFLGLSPLELVLFPLPVAACVAQRRPLRALGLAGVAAFAGAVVLGGARAVVFYGLFAALGAPFGLGLWKGWPYGRTVLAASACAFALVAGIVLLSWPEWTAFSTLFWDAAVTELETEAAHHGGERVQAVVESMTWFRDHVADVGFGLMLWMTAAASCVALSALWAWARRRLPAAGLRGSFRQMRVSEWLVWAAIAVAGLWFIDRQWPIPALRMVSWNAAAALAGVYWLNGVSVAAYGFDVLRPHLFVCMAAIVVLITFGVHPVFCFVGLFDTWGNFRRVIDAMAAARRQRDETGGPGDDDESKN